ncbi:unnamed protein product [Ilex paraguariensis]|uniref:Uncharacterized protein n=1 Tax=Ilex paraguariensis TaxID=185542 RepID=A0ABC8UVK3_9AQUA
MIVDDSPDGIAQTEVKLSSKETGGGLGLNEDTMNVDLPMKGQPEEGVMLGTCKRMRSNGKGGLGSKIIEDIDKFKYVGSAGFDQYRKEKGDSVGVGARRELPFSMREQEKKVSEGKGSRGDPAKKKALNDLLDALRMVIGDVEDGSEGVDFLETAKRCGMIFPRPRWWPPEGFDD